MLGKESGMVVDTGSLTTQQGNKMNYRLNQ